MNWLASIPRVLFHFGFIDRGGTEKDYSNCVWKALISHNKNNQITVNLDNFFTKWKRREKVQIFPWIIIKSYSCSKMSYLKMKCYFPHVFNVFREWYMRTKPRRVWSHRVITTEISYHQFRLNCSILQTPKTLCWYNGTKKSLAYTFSQ